MRWKSTGPNPTPSRYSLPNTLDQVQRWWQHTANRIPSRCGGEGGGSDGEGGGSDGEGDGSDGGSDDGSGSDGGGGGSDGEGGSSDGEGGVRSGCWQRRLLCGSPVLGSWWCFVSIVT